MNRQIKHKIWVLIHSEFKAVGDETVVDEAVFYVFSSLRMAERFIRSIRVESFSWWTVQQFDVDEVNENEVVCHYNYKGKPVTSPPFKQALRNFKRKDP